MLNIKIEKTLHYPNGVSILSRIWGKLFIPSAYRLNKPKFPHKFSEPTRIPLYPHESLIIPLSGFSWERNPHKNNNNTCCNVVILLDFFACSFHCIVCIIRFHKGKLEILQKLKSSSIFKCLLYTYILYLYCNLSPIICGSNSHC